MNGLAVTLFWCVTQVTLLAIVAGVLYCVLRRFGPALGASVVLTAMLCMTAATAFSLSPWPNWMSAIEARLALENSLTRSSAAENPQAETELAGPGGPRRDVAYESPVRAAVSGFWEQLRSARVAVEQDERTWNWHTILIGLLFVAVGCGLLRLAIGCMAIRRYRHASKPITDRALNELTDILAAELGCVRAVELRECAAIEGAATIGWRRPLILLPPSWRSWDEQHRRTVLAHELAHIYHNDFLTWLVAQFGLALHFYHPLAHWLCACLRLDQELVADATAARLAGGQQTYLLSLAQIALQQTESRVTWSARTFLPTRRTFLRRIEMLRDSKQWLSHPPTSLRWLAKTVLLGAGLIAVGLRGPIGLAPQTAWGQQPPTTTPAQPSAVSDAFSLSYVPRDAIAVVGLRPAKLLNKPAFQSLAKLVRDPEGLEKEIGISPERIESWQLIALPITDVREPMAFVVRCLDAASAQKIIAANAPQATKESWGTFEYLRSARNTFYFVADERTMVVARDEGVLRRCIVAGVNGAKSANWASSWNEVATHDAAGLLNTAAIRPMLAQEFGPPGDGRPRTPAQAFQMQFAPFAPFWQQCDIAVAGAKIDETMSIKIMGKSATAEDAKRVHDTLKSSVTLGQNMLSQARQNAANSRSPDGALILGAIDIADELLENIKIEQNGALVTATISASAADTSQMLAMVAPAIVSAREAARWAQSSNNMKQIALAFHNYHDTYRHFPPAVSYSENKVPRSWRVELLPFLEASDVYNQYRKDEPWDSEHNKKLLARMPAVYRDPNESAGSTNASYFLLTGPGTIFHGVTGSSMAHILDGTSNTLLAVQAKRAIPWTKPEDIPYADDKPFPKLGGYTRGSFLAALADGSVRSFSDTTDERVLRLMTTCGDGQPLPPFNP